MSVRRSMITAILVAAVAATAIGCGGGTTTPTGPYNPTPNPNPYDPANPSGPTDPTNPSNPTNPQNPTNPSDPANPAGPAAPSNGTWLQMQSPTSKVIYRIWSDGANTWAVGFWGTILKHQGGVWQQVQQYGAGNNFYDIWASSSSDIWAVGGGTSSACDIAHFDGSQWSKPDACPIEGQKGLFGIWGTSSTDIFAVGAKGSIVHYDGRGWTTMQSPTTEDLWGVWGSSAGRVYAVGDKGTIVHYDGSAWSQVNSGTRYQLRSVWGSGPNNIWAVGDGWNAAGDVESVVLRNTGAGWQIDAAATAVAPSRLYGITGDGNRVWISGSKGSVIKFDGSQWHGEVTPVSNTLHGIANIGGQLWAVGSQGTILQYK